MPGMKGSIDCLLSYIAFLLALIASAASFFNIKVMWLYSSIPSTTNAKFWGAVYIIAWSLNPDNLPLRKGPKVTIRNSVVVPDTPLKMTSNTVSTATISKLELLNWLSVSYFIDPHIQIEVTDWKDGHVVSTSAGFWLDFLCVCHLPAIYTWTSQAKPLTLNGLSPSFGSGCHH